ncbi:unnamed protein product [Larinioides sclopetarius]|uniref:Cytochrome c oxidase copper chaperone n=1 Tax=Larinioides sclopetarius TaxID=280406 RepID=A0AAV1ZVV0_9ARAC
MIFQDNLILYSVMENEREKRMQKEKEEPKKLKPCCACPETRKVRDACIAEKGAEACSKELEAHKECMKKMGFNV